MTIEIWFDYGSTYSHLAIQRLATPVLYRPFLLGAIFKAQGWSDSPFNVFPAKGAYMWRDMEREAARYSVAYRKPSVFPRNGVRASRVTLAAIDQPWLPALVRSIFAANFRDDRDISQPEVMAELLAAFGATELLDRAATPEIKAALRSNTDEAARDGIFGAPMFRVGGELFWGNDRLELALAAGR